MRVVPQDIGEQIFERVITLQLPFDLAHESFSNRFGVAEQPYRYLRVPQDLLDRACIGDDGALVVLPPPDVEMTVWC